MRQTYCKKDKFESTEGVEHKEQERHSETTMSLLATPERLWDDNYSVALHFEKTHSAEATLISSQILISLKHPKTL